jgi:hypothetical protein
MPVRTSRISTLLAVLIALAVPSATAAQGTGANGDGGGDDPSKATAQTNKGGSCNLHALLARNGAAMTFGGRVPSCSAKFGIKHVTARAFLYEGINTAEQAAVTGRVRGNVPFEIAQSFTGQASQVYEARFDVTVVIKGGKSMTKPKRPEKWSKAGKGCEITTTNRSGDTLGCVFGLESQPAG